MEFGSGLQVWKVEPGWDWKSWGLGILLGDPEGLGEDRGLLLWIGPAHLFVGRGLTWLNHMETP